MWSTLDGSSPPEASPQGFQLLRRAGWDEEQIGEVARVMEYTQAYELYRDDREELTTAGAA